MNTICFSMITILIIGLLTTDLVTLPLIRENKKLIIFCIVLFYINHGYRTNFELEDKSCGAWCQRLRGVIN
jgi:hypothetical protein